MSFAESIRRHFTKSDQSPFDQIQWRTAHVEAPVAWSDTAIEIAASKYFRRRGVSGGGENSIRQMIFRVVRTIRLAGEWQGYFKGPQAQIFEDELTHILLC